MQTSYRREYSAMPTTQIPTTQMSNTQQFGTQSVLPNRGNRFQFQHEQDQNFRSTSFVQPMKSSFVNDVKDRPLPQFQEFEFQPKQFQQKTSFVAQPIVTQAPKPLIQTTVPIQNTWTPQPPLKQSTIPVAISNFPTHEFNSPAIEPRQQSIYWNLEKPVSQPPIVTQTPVLEYEPRIDRKYRVKARDEYCGIYTKTRPDNYRSQISQEEPEDKENPYWLCHIF